MSAIPFFDCNCQIGVRANRHKSTIWRLEDYRRDFDYCDIVGAVVSHAVAQEYSPDCGNRRLLREIGDDPQLVPQWVLIPHHTGEMPPAPELVAEMLSLGVRTARIMPKTNVTGTSEAIIGPLLSELERHRVPLFVDKSEIDLPDLVQLCQAHPMLPVVLCGQSWGGGRTLYPALAAAPNLHIETWAYQEHRAYEEFIRRFGPERLLFGTDLPNRSPGAATMMTRYEDISEEARHMIAGGNLMRLLKNVRGAQGRPLPELKAPATHPDDDPIVACTRAGKPLSDEFVLDAHGHIAHPGAMGVYIPLAYNDADNLVKSMDRMGIDICCFSPWSGIITGDPEANDISLDAVERHPDRLLAYGCDNPNYPEFFNAEYERVFLTDRVIGYKPYPRHGLPFDHPALAPLMEWANVNEKPVLCHAMRPDISEKLAAKYPGAKFLVAHAGSSWDLAEGTARVAREFKNVYAEITYTSILYGFIEFFCEEVCPEQLLFGSDCVMRDIAPQLGWVTWARIPYEDKQKVLGQNMADILKMPMEQRTPRS